MGFLRRIRTRLQPDSLSKRLFLSYVFFCFVPLALMGWIVAATSFDLLTQQAEESVEASILQTQQNLESVLSFYEHLSENYIYDSSLVNAISKKYESSAQLVDTYHMLWNMRSKLMKVNLDIRDIVIYTHNETMIEVSSYIKKIPEDMLDDYAGLSGWFGFSSCLVHPPLAEMENSVCYLRSFHTSDSNSAILCFEIKTEPLYELIHLEGANKQVFILDDGDRIITSSGGFSLGERIQTVLPLQGDLADNSSVYNQAMEGGRRLWVLPLRGGWKICTVISLSEAMEKANTVKFFCLIGMIAVVIADVTLILFFTGGFTRRVNMLIDKIQRVDYHNLQPLDAIGGNDEVAMVDSIFTRMARRIETQIQEATLLQSQKKDAQLQALQARINPHFLYNTLSAIGWMTETHSPAEVRDAISLCATYYRATLSGGRDIIPLGEELDGLKAYLNLQKIRAAGRIHVFDNVDPLLLPFEIPKMTLQPIVENSLEHGYSEGKEGIVIQISAYAQEGYMILQVEDDGAGMAQDQIKKLVSGELSALKGSYGFKNVFDRLALHFGKDFYVEVNSEPLKKTVISFHIPFQSIAGGEPFPLQS